MEKWLIPGLKQGKYKLSLEHLVALESKEEKEREKNRKIQGREEGRKKRKKEEKRKGKKRKERGMLDGHRSPSKRPMAKSRTI